MTTGRRLDATDKPETVGVRGLCLALVGGSELLSDGPLPSYRGGCWASMTVLVPWW